MANWTISTLLRRLVDVLIQRYDIDATITQVISNPEDYFDGVTAADVIVDLKDLVIQKEMGL